MPQFNYRGRDKEGQLRVGQRFSESAESLNNELTKEGISVIAISLQKSKYPLSQKISEFFKGQNLQLTEIAIFARQMQLLQNANVPMIVALRQLGSFTRSHRLAHALEGIIENLQRGQSLATAMQQYPEVFSPLITNVIRIGETTGHLAEAFGNIYEYVEFEATINKQLRAAFRYPIFAFITMGLAILVINIFVIPSFARFYTQLTVALPWQTTILINMSNFFVKYGVYLLMILLAAFYLFKRQLRTYQGRVWWDSFLLRLPVLGPMLKKIAIIRFCQAMAIILQAGLSLTEGLNLVKNIVNNYALLDQIKKMQENIERGVPFTQAIMQTDLFNSLEIQILAVGEKNGELAPALKYISNFNHQEIDYQVKKINDVIGPLLVAGVSVLILIMALGVYLPVWNMVNLMQQAT